MSEQTELHPILPANEQGRDFVTADLHGHRRRLDQALESWRFDPGQDRLLSVGDLIDRGPDSPGCLDLLHEPWFYTVRGNHEQMLIDAVRQRDPNAMPRWQLNGGQWAEDRADAWLQNWARALDQLPFTLTVEHPQGKIGICHAQYSLPHWEDRLNADREERTDWLWGRSRLRSVEPGPVGGIDWLFHGHTIVPEVKRVANSVFLDCGAFTGGPLVVLSLNEWMTDPSTARVNRELV